MNFLSNSTGENLEGAEELQRVQRRSVVQRSEERVAALRRALVQEQRKLRVASVREAGIREKAVGRAVWALVERGALPLSVMALVRDEVRACLTAPQERAFRETPFE